MSNLKKFNIFVFITSFAKGLIEVFIPLILFDKGFTIKEILLFLIIKHSICTILSLTTKIYKKASCSFLLVISSLFFSTTYIYLNFLKDNIISLIILSILSSIYTSIYWTVRHVYALRIIESKKATDNTSSYQIFTLLGILMSTFIGAEIIEHLGYFILSIIVLIIMNLSIFPLLKIKSKETKKLEKLKNIASSFPLRNYIFTFIDQFRNISIYLFPLYVYLHIKRKFTYLGIVNIICGISSIVYIYYLAKKMDKNKKDYLRLSSILLALTFLIKLNIKGSIIFLIVAFFEGIFKSSLDTIVQRNTYAYGKNFGSISYIGFSETIINTSKAIILLIFYILNLDLQLIILISVLTIFINSFIGFDDGKFGYNKLNN